MSIDNLAAGAPMFQKLGEESLQTWRPERLASLYASIMMYWEGHALHPADEANLDMLHRRLTSMSPPEKKRVYQLLAPGKVRDIYTTHILSVGSQN
jgi:hypothetical protein